MATIVFISALQKHLAFQDDLLRRLRGKTLVERSIEKARNLGIRDSSIHVYTDSEQIALQAERIGVQAFLNVNLLDLSVGESSNFIEYCCASVTKDDQILRLSPYAPLLESSTLDKAAAVLEQANVDAVCGIRTVRQSLYMDRGRTVESIFLSEDGQILDIESSAFTLLKAGAIKKLSNKTLMVQPVEVSEDAFEINSYWDWWVCEKLLARKRIVFRVIGGDRVGMGHIYRALTVAHEITDHEVLMVTDTSNEVALNKLMDYGYRLEVYERSKIVEEIIELSPNMVVNDILDTNADDIRAYKQKGIKVVNFEDLGEGAKLSDLTFNELYDQQQFTGNNIYWGKDYFFVRDEFAEATPCVFRQNIDAILLVFGGIDQHDLSQKILFQVLGLCRARNIHIYVVTGPGYTGYHGLRKKVDRMDDVTLTHATGVISRIMEKVSLAITSNGRTVYEMAHMNIPAIVIPQHDREKTHDFACEENGFVALEPYQQGVTEQVVLEQLTRILDDQDYRRFLYDNTQKFLFHKNKTGVLKLIIDLLN